MPGAKRRRAEPGPESPQKRASPESGHRTPPLSILESVDGLVYEGKAYHCHRSVQELASVIAARVDKFGGADAVCSAVEQLPQPDLERLLVPMRGHPTQETLFRTLLRVDSLQEGLIETMLSKLPEMDCGAAASTSNMARLTLLQLRWLPCLAQPQQVAEQLQLVLESSSAGVQHEVLSALPEVVDDAHHATLLPTLEGLIEAQDLLVPAVDCITALALSPEALRPLLARVLRRLPSAPLSSVPVLVRMLLRAVRADDAVLVLRVLRKALRIEHTGVGAAADGSGGHAEPPHASGAGQHGQSPGEVLALVVEALRSGLRSRADVAAVWLRAVTAPTRGEDIVVLDVWLMLCLCTVEGLQAKARAMFLRKLKRSEVPLATLRRSIRGHGVALLPFATILLDAARALLPNAAAAVRDTGAQLYTAVFSEMHDDATRQEVVQRLLSHAGSGVEVETSAALAALCALAEDPRLLPHVRKSAPFLKGTLDFVHRYTLPQLRAMFRMLSALAFAADADADQSPDEEEAGAGRRGVDSLGDMAVGGAEASRTLGAVGLCVSRDANELDIVVRKLLSQRSTHLRCVGIIGSVSLALRLATQTAVALNARAAQRSASSGDAASAAGDADGGGAAAAAGGDDRSGADQPRLLPTEQRAMEAAKMEFSHLVRRAEGQIRASGPCYAFLCAELASSMSRAVPHFALEWVVDHFTSAIEVLLTEDTGKPISPEHPAMEPITLRGLSTKPAVQFAVEGSEEFAALDLIRARQLPARASAADAICPLLHLQAAASTLLHPDGVGEMGMLAVSGALLVDDDTLATAARTEAADGQGAAAASSAGAGAASAGAAASSGEAVAADGDGGGGEEAMAPSIAETLARVPRRVREDVAAALWLTAGYLRQVITCFAGYTPFSLFVLRRFALLTAAEQRLQEHARLLPGWTPPAWSLALAQEMRAGPGGLQASAPHAREREGGVGAAGAASTPAGRKGKHRRKGAAASVPAAASPGGLGSKGAPAKTQPLSGQATARRSLDALPPLGPTAVLALGYGLSDATDAGEDLEAGETAQESVPLITDVPAMRKLVGRAIKQSMDAPPSAQLDRDTTGRLLDLLCDTWTDALAEAKRAARPNPLQGASVERAQLDLEAQLRWLLVGISNTVHRPQARDLPSALLLLWQQNSVYAGVRRLMDEAAECFAQSRGNGAASEADSGASAGDHQARAYDRGVQVLTSTAAWLQQRVATAKRMGLAAGGRAERSGPNTGAGAGGLSPGAAAREASLAGAPAGADFVLEDALTGAKVLASFQPEPEESARPRTCCAVLAKLGEAALGAFRFLRGTAEAGARTLAYAAAIADALHELVRLATAALETAEEKAREAGSHGADAPRGAGSTASAATDAASHRSRGRAGPGPVSSWEPDAWTPDLERQLQAAQAQCRSAKAELSDFAAWALREDWSVAEPRFKPSPAPVRALVAVHITCARHLQDTVDAICRDQLPMLTTLDRHQRAVEGVPQLTRATAPAWFDAVMGALVSHLKSFFETAALDESEVERDFRQKLAAAGAPASKEPHLLFDEAEAVRLDGVAALRQASQDRLTVLTRSVTVMDVLMALTKSFATDRKLVNAAFAGAVPFVEAFLRSGVPLVKRWLAHPEPLVKMLRRLQKVTRQLQAMCADHKAYDARKGKQGKSRSVPKVKAMLERLIYAIKEVLQENECGTAFYQGNLKHRGVDGAEVQSDYEGVDDPDEEEEEEEEGGVGDGDAGQEEQD